MSAIFGPAKFLLGFALIFPIGSAWAIDIDAGLQLSPHRYLLLVTVEDILAAGKDPAIFDNPYFAVAEYWPNGNPFIRGSFSFSKPIGEWTVFDESGVVRVELVFSDGHILGPLIVRNSTGQVVLSGRVTEGGLADYYEEGKDLAW